MRGGSFEPPTSISWFDKHPWVFAARARPEQILPGAPDLPIRPIGLMGKSNTTPRIRTDFIYSSSTEFRRNTEINLEPTELRAKSSVE